MTTATRQNNNAIFNRPKSNSETANSTPSTSEKALYYAAARKGVGECLERIALARELGIPLSELQDF